MTKPISGEEQEQAYMDFLHANQVMYWSKRLGPRCTKTPGGEEMKDDNALKRFVHWAAVFILAGIGSNVMYNVVVNEASPGLELFAVMFVGGAVIPTILYNLYQIFRAKGD